MKAFAETYLPKAGRTGQGGRKEEADAQGTREMLDIFLLRAARGSHLQMSVL